jgi:glycogen debranching enzyme
LRELWPAVEKALHWIDSSGDLDGDGFLEYSGLSQEGLQHGLRNQGWKDSFDAIFHADGELAQGPIALCEVQGYAYAAQCARRLGRGEAAEKLDHAAETLAQRFEEAFWCEDIGLYTLWTTCGKRHIIRDDAGLKINLMLSRPALIGQRGDLLIQSLKVIRRRDHVGQISLGGRRRTA